MASYDHYDIEKQLKQIDDRVLRIDFDYSRERHLVIAYDQRNEVEYIAFTVPHGQLDDRVVQDFRKMCCERYSAFDELREWEAKKERDDERRIEDYAHNMADMLYKPLLRDATGA